MILKSSLLVQEPELTDLIQVSVLSLVPLRRIPPPSAVLSVAPFTEPNSICLSSTDNVVELIVVVVPFIVKSPVSVKSCAFILPFTSNFSDTLPVIPIPTFPPILASAVTERPVPEALLSVNVSVIVVAVLSSTSLCHTPL